MKRTLTLLLLSICSAGAFAQQKLASWSFNGVTSTNTGTTVNISAGSAQADSGVNATGSAFTAVHTSASTVWSNPAGNGSAKSVSSNNWSVGDYYQFKVSTTGFSGISISWDQTGSGTGPKSFKVQYSNNGTTYTDVPSTVTNATYDLALDSWSAATPVPASNRTVNLSTITNLDNVANIYIRLTSTSTVSIANGTVGTGGTGRVDNFTVMANPLSPLSLHLLSFTASANKGNVSLNWTTADEQQVKGFSVEKSTDGSNYSELSFVPAQNNVASGAYSLTDVAGNNTNYYRLKMINEDGTASYSKVLTVLNNKETSRPVVYPNPVSGGVLTIAHTAATGATLQVIDTKGAIVLKSSVANDELQTSINVSSLPDGNYFIIFQNGTTRQSVPFCKY